MPLQAFPIWVVIIDYVFGIIMWTLIGRSAMGLFQREDSKFFFMRFFVVTTDPIIKAFRIVIPKFLVPLLVPLYVAWFFYMIRFYLIPWILGYSIMGMLSFPLESEITQFLLKFFQKQF
jgi:hypothetical protein